MSEVARILGGGGGVLDRARGPVEADDAMTAVYRAIDYYPSPPWAGRAGGEILRRLDPGPWTLCDPMCGEGHLAHGLADYFPRVVGSDVFPHGFGQVLDYRDALAVGDVDWVVTNPAFPLSTDLIDLALQRARRGVAILQKLSFLETVGRFDLIWGERPLTVHAPFAERVPMQLGGWDPGGSTATPYAWHIWIKAEVAHEVRDPLVAAAMAGRRYVGEPIPPGTRQRLSRVDDARRFARRPIRNRPDQDLAA